MADTPTYVGANTYKTSAFDIAFTDEPTGAAEGDFYLMSVCYVENVADLDYVAPDGWTEWGVHEITEGGTSHVQYFWTVRGASAPELTFVRETPTSPQPQNNYSARIAAFRNVDPDNPLPAWGDIEQGKWGPGSLPVALPGMTTPTDNCLWVAVPCNGGRYFWVTTPTNANLTSVTQAYYDETSYGVDSCIALWYGEMATAGAIGDTSFAGAHSNVTSYGVGYSSFYLNPVGAGGGGGGGSQKKIIIPLYYN